VLFEGPNTIGPCDDLELSIMDPTPRARYTWICLNDPQLTAAALDRKVDSQTVRFLSGDFKPINGPYKFILSAVSIFGSSANSSVLEVFRSPAAIPKIISSTLSAFVTSPIVLQALVEFSSCPVKDGKIIFSWSASEDSAALADVLKKTLSSTLLIPSNMLEAGRSYRFTCSVYKDDEPSKTNSATYTVTTLQSPLKVSISGGNRVASVQSSVTLDASASFDPDIVGLNATVGLRFSWRCRMVRNQESSQCRDVKGTLLNLTNTPILRFSSDILAAETLYQFDLDVAKGARVTSDSTYIQIGQGSFIDDAKLILASQERVDSNEKFLSSAKRQQKYYHLLTAS